jgi:hypothetical protein
MKGRLKLAVGGGLVLVTAGVAVSGTSASPVPGADSRKDGEVIRLVAKEVASDFLDLGSSDQGDQIPFTNDLYRGDKKVGEDGGWCVATRSNDQGYTVQCLGVNSLPGGQIAVQGLVTYGPGDDDHKLDPYQFAITGGTGKYRGARGTVTIEEVSSEEFHLTFRVRD